MKAKTKLFTDLKFGDFFSFCPNLYKGVIFMKTEPYRNTGMGFDYNAIWVKGRAKGKLCHFTQTSVTPIPRCKVKF